MFFDRAEKPWGWRKFWEGFGGSGGGRGGGILLEGLERRGYECWGAGRGLGEGCCGSVGLRRRKGY